jgi:mycothiol synthase
MSSNYIIRNFRDSDFPSLVHLIMRHGKAGFIKCDDPVKRLSLMFRRPAYQATENVLIAEVHGEVAGYINILPEPGIERVIFDYLFVPECETGPIPGELFTRALAKVGKSDIKFVHVEVSPADSPVLDLVSRLGFNKVTRYYLLEIDVSKEELEINDSDDALVCCMGEGEHGLLVEIQNACFVDHWGYEPVNRESISWWLDFWQNSSEDIIFAWSGNRVAGYCWTVEKYGYEPSTETHTGCIFMLGVDSSHRTTGLGRRLLYEGLRLLQHKGCGTVTITVDSRNETAFNLYTSAGFRKSAETMWYEKTMK